MTKKHYTLLNLAIFIPMGLALLSFGFAIYFQSNGYAKEIWVPLALSVFCFLAVSLIFLFVNYPALIEYRTKKKYEELKKRPLCFAYQSETIESLTRRLGKLGFYPDKNGMLYNKIPYLLTGSIRFYIAIVDADENPAYFENIIAKYHSDPIYQSEKGYRCLTVIGMKKKLSRTDAAKIKKYTDEHLTLDSALFGSSAEASFWMLYESGKGRFLFKNVGNGSKIKAAFIGGWMLKKLLLLNNTEIVCETDDPFDSTLLSPEK
ncbi:MAG TPA: hypothetical protein PLH02_04635 [Bacillota bacterium]|nr:hypothetical protein [Bacillota bacterium]HPF42493.1 hypothetical protein [Bacillota bacterium]HPJ85852.1 hypothetical protein [Bacillota bacterium]HPQ62136.1 hypothetical protein [Bacillota bacterium]HRX91674.1 hypothetical protein [Candidatus Izemoplasmatales bacterium]